MNETQHLTDPYQTLEDEQKATVQGRIPTADFLLLRNISVKRGILQIVINNLLKGFTDECRASGIDYNSPENLDLFHTILRRRSAFQPVGQAADPNVSAGVDGVRDQSPQPANITTDPKGKNSKGSVKQTAKRK